MTVEIDLSVVAKRGKDWLIGKIENGVFTAYKQIKRLKDVGDASSYVTLKNYLKSRKLNSALDVAIMEQTGLSSIYVLSRPSYCDEAEWDSYWWKLLNDKCLSCKKKCKQSSFANIVECPQYEKE
jgi:hypothetical protein